MRSVKLTADSKWHLNVCMCEYVYVSMSGSICVCVGTHDMHACIDLSVVCLSVYVWANLSGRQIVNKGVDCTHQVQ